MKREMIYGELREWLELMVAKYTWLSVRYEYNAARGCFLVSFYPEDMTAESSAFCRDALAFEDKMNEELGDDAPLFCDGESLFKLSPEAELLTGSRRREKRNNPARVPQGGGWLRV